jgi:hypothetical protein
MHFVRVKRTNVTGQPVRTDLACEVLEKLGVEPQRHRYGDADLLFFASLPIAREVARRLRAIGLLG